MSESEVLPESRRPDGSLRPAVRVKKGYVPPEEQQTYDKFKQTGPVEIPGADPSAAPKAKSKTAAKNEKRKQARKAEQNKEVDIVKELDAKLRMGVTAPPPTTVTAPAAAAPTPDANGGVPPAADVNTATPPPPAAPVAPAPATESEPNEVEKKVRALKKKLRAADDLIAKQTDGSILNADQLAKVAARGEIEAEIARWESLKDVEELVKEVKKLGKKLRQIEELEERAVKGEALNADQKDKISQKDKVAAEYAKLTELKESIVGKS